MLKSCSVVFYIRLPRKSLIRQRYVPLRIARRRLSWPVGLYSCRTPQQPLIVGSAAKKSCAENPPKIILASSALRQILLFEDPPQNRHWHWCLRWRQCDLLRIIHSRLARQHRYSSILSSSRMRVSDSWLASYSSKQSSLSADKLRRICFVRDTFSSAFWTVSACQCNDFVHYSWNVLSHNMPVLAVRILVAQQ